MTEQNKLVIVESPTKARKIGGYLGSGYTVMASVGHIRDLAQPSQVPAAKKAEFGKFGVDVNNGFEPYYVVGADKKKTVSDLKAALAKSGELFLATDEDREGEAIAWHLVQALKPKVPVKRMVFHEITKPAIQASLANTRDVDDHMVDAQETRRVLDRLYGYELSPVLWRKVGPGLSAGRVQSVATRLIVERERERMAFRKASYWDVCADLSANGVDFTARMTALNGARLAGSKDFNSLGELQKVKGESALAHYLSEADACAIAQILGAADFVVNSMDTKPYRRRSLPPFTTSTLQQTAGNRLSMSSRQTMRAAQSLYENGYITYMRTDSVTLSKEAIFAARDCVKSSFGSEYLADSPKQYATTSAGAQEAHECIRPAGSTFRNPADLAGVLPADQLKLYTLIWQRTLASQMADATGFTATVKLDALAGSFGTANFQASGTVIEFAGFMKVFGGFSEDEQSKALPPMANGDVLKALQVSADGHETQPPARYTEASLVKTLEAKEIGRPSTYASIISTIIDRGYVYERGRALIPSWLAFAVIKLLESNFPTYVDYAFTADMENGLDRIAHGEEAGKDWLYKFYFGDDEAAVAGDSRAEAGDFAMREGLQKQVDQLGEIDAREINTIDIGGGLHVRVGRYGPYLEDTKNLDEEGNARRASIPSTLAPDELSEQVARDLIENNSDGPRVLGTDPQTGGSVEVRNGRFGAYVALVEAADEASGEGKSQATDDSAKTGAKSSAKSSAKSKKTAKAKPKMASLFKTMDPATITLQDALKLLNLPRLVGVVEEVDEQGEVKRARIEANNGRYGPYLTKTYERTDSGDSAAYSKPDNRSLASEDAIFSVTLDEAKELFAQPKYGKRTRGAAKPPLRELGEDPESGKPVVIKDGFYGAYITDGVTNRTLPKQYTPESIEPQVAFELLAQKRAAGPVKRKRAASKKTATKKTAAKKTAAKKPAAKKSTAKKSTSKAE
ncbi:DNA topoisomerase I [Gardnerella vaginalis]|uniref:DNA topoisomerase 1 n=1 Tax=Gardnerella piotii TaxID=2792977 RepID=A0ABU5MRY1_9BIFI|nr:type I DNA topoisomerase [Gardnerella piotii]MDZ7545174.1 type I DNA topoisomerase [Gardnerella piotii]MDZ7552584.1 type I DNA topoisomerase [Gardnerella piotii]RFT24792.1 DNA topoisomerase I [Gardnerella vaginalis]